MGVPGRTEYELIIEFKARLGQDDCTPMMSVCIMPLKCRIDGIHLSSSQEWKV